MLACRVEFSPDDTYAAHIAAREGCADDLRDPRAWRGGLAACTQRGRADGRSLCCIQGARSLPTRAARARRFEYTLRAPARWFDTRPFCVHEWPRRMFAPFARARALFVHPRRRQWLRPCSLRRAPRPRRLPTRPHELGFSLAALNKNGDAPAHFAARQGHDKTLYLLHDLGAGESLSAGNKRGHAPAHLAAVKGHLACLRALRAGVAHRRDSRRGLEHAAHLAAKDRCLDCLRVLNCSGALLQTNARGRTPAHLAAAAGHAAVARALRIEGGRLLSAADGKCHTPAHLAAHNGHTHCLCTLHELGAAASFAKADDSGRLPVHFAAGRGHADSLRLRARARLLCPYLTG